MEKLIDFNTGIYPLCMYDTDSVKGVEWKHKENALRLLQRIHENSLYGIHSDKMIRSMTQTAAIIASTASPKHVLMASRFIIRRDPETGKRYWEPLMHHPSCRCTKGQGEAVPVADYKRKMLLQ